MKPRAIYVADKDILPRVFGASQRDELDRLLEFVDLPITASAMVNSTMTYPEVEVMITSWTPPCMDEKMLARFPRLRAIFHAAGTVKPLVTDALWRRGIRVSSAAHVNALPVAEFAFSQIIFALRHGWQRVFEVRNGLEFRREDDDVRGAYGAVVGLLSLGHTGRLVAEKLKTLEVEVIACDPFFPEDRAREVGVSLCTLEDVFRRSDVVSCHTPLLPETTQLIRGGHFAAMPRGATFINTARGAVVNETEMSSVLTRRPDLWAILDVTWPEPPALDSPLRRLTNVVLTPHIAGSLGREYGRIGQMITAEVGRYLRREALLGEVTNAQLPLIA